MNITNKDHWTLNHITDILVAEGLYGNGCFPDFLISIYMPYKDYASTSFPFTLSHTYIAKECGQP